MQVPDRCCGRTKELSCARDRAGAKREREEFLLRFFPLEQLALRPHRPLSLVPPPSLCALPALRLVVRITQLRFPRSRRGTSKQIRGPPVHVRRKGFTAEARREFFLRCVASSSPATAVERAACARLQSNRALASPLPGLCCPPCPREHCCALLRLRLCRQREINQRHVCSRKAKRNFSLSLSLSLARSLCIPRCFFFRGRRRSALLLRSPRRLLPPS